MTNLSKNGENIDSGKRLEKQYITVFKSIFYIHIVRYWKYKYYFESLDVKVRYNNIKNKRLANLIPVVFYLADPALQKVKFLPMLEQVS